MHPLIANLKGKLIVSVQAYPGEPMRHPETMAHGFARVRLDGDDELALQVCNERVHVNS